MAEKQGRVRAGSYGELEPSGQQPVQTFQEAPTRHQPECRSKTDRGFRCPRAPTQDIQLPLLMAVQPGPVPARRTAGTGLLKTTVSESTWSHFQKSQDLCLGPLSNDYIIFRVTQMEGLEPVFRLPCHIHRVLAVPERKELSPLCTVEVQDLTSGQSPGQDAPT